MIRNQKGIGLIQTLAVIGLLAFLAGGTALLFTQFYNQSVNNQSVKDVNLSFLKIKSMMSSFNSCTNTLAPLAASFPTGPSVPRILNHLGASAYVPQTTDPGPASYVSGTKIRLRSLQLQNYTATPDPNEFLIMMRLEFEIESGGPAFLNNRMSKYLPISLRYNGPAFVSCFSTGSIGMDDEYLNHFQDDTLPTTHKRDQLSIIGRLHVLTSSANPANSGFIYSLGFYQTSDRNQKQEIRKIHDPLLRVHELQAYEYELIHSAASEYGFLAQELETTAPFLVRSEESGSKSLNYPSLIGLSLESTKKVASNQRNQARRITNLKNRLSALKNDLSDNTRRSMETGQ